MTVVFNHLTQFFKRDNIARATMTLYNFIDLFFEQRGANAARRTKSTTFMCKEMTEIMNNI
jgi:hypothetical protein